METREYECSFGIVKVTIDGNQCNGTYQKSGKFNGTIDGDIVKAKWNNEDQEGLIELNLGDDNLTGKWKQGLDVGPMRGKWNGVRIQTQEIQYGISLSDSEKNRFEEEESRIDAISGCVESEMEEYIELANEIWETSKGKEKEWVKSILKKTMQAVVEEKESHCVTEIIYAFFEMEGMIPKENNEQILNYLFNCIIESDADHEALDNYLYDLIDFKAPHSMIDKVSSAVLESLDSSWALSIEEKDIDRLIELVDGYYHFSGQEFENNFLLSKYDEIEPLLDQAEDYFNLSKRRLSFEKNRNIGEEKNEKTSSLLEKAIDLLDDGDLLVMITEHLRKELEDLPRMTQLIHEKKDLIEDFTNALSLVESTHIAKEKNLCREFIEKAAQYVEKAAEDWNVEDDCSELYNLCLSEFINDKNLASNFAKYIT